MRENQPKAAEVLHAIEVLKAHLDSDWIGGALCADGPHVLGCVSCAAVHLKSELDGVAGYLREDEATLTNGDSHGND